MLEFTFPFVYLEDGLKVFGREFYQLVEELFRQDVNRGDQYGGGCIRRDWSRQLKVD
jgi:hypothetical protein